MAEDALIWGRFLSPLLNSFSDSRKQGERGGGDLRSVTPGPKLVLHTLFNQNFL